MQMSTGGKYPIGVAGTSTGVVGGCATQQAEIPQALLTLKNAIEDAGRAADGLRDKLRLVTNPSERPGRPECAKQPEPTKSPLATELDSMTAMARRLTEILTEQTERTELS